MKLQNIKTEDNLADAPTKPVNAETLKYHVDHSSAECRKDRHRLAPGVARGDEEVDDTRRDGSEQEQRLESRAAEEEEAGAEEY